MLSVVSNYYSTKGSPEGDELMKIPNEKCRKFIRSMSVKYSTQPLLVLSRISKDIRRYSAIVVIISITITTISFISLPLPSIPFIPSHSMSHTIPMLCLYVCVCIVRFLFICHCFCVFCACACVCLSLLPLEHTFHFFISKSGSEPSILGSDPS